MMSVVFKMLVVNGTGFIGARVVSALAAGGHQVTVLHRGLHNPSLPGGVIEIRDPDAGIPVLSYPESIRRGSFDVVVLMTAMGEADTLAAVECFSGRAGRLVLVSSCDVYRQYGAFLRNVVDASGFIAEQTISESSPLRLSRFPHGIETGSPYGTLHGYDKILAEQVVTAASDVLPFTIARLPKVYGSGDRQRVFGEWVEAIRKGLRVKLPPAVAKWRWTHGYVDDVAAGIAIAALSGSSRNRIYNFGEAEVPTMAERLSLIESIMGFAAEGATVADAPPQNDRLDYTIDLVFDTTAARAELGYGESLTAQESVKRTVSQTHIHA